MGGLGAMEMESGKIRLKEVKRKNAGRDDWNGGGGIWRMMWKTSSAKTS